MFGKLSVQIMLVLIKDLYFNVHLLTLKTFHVHFYYRTNSIVLAGH